jgi:hypothetical protein
MLIHAANMATSSHCKPFDHMPPAWQVSPHMKFPVCHSEMEGLLYKFSPAPEPQPTQDSDNHLHALSMFWIQLPRHQAVPLVKWKERSRVGLYLGCSPIHAQSFALVLNLQQDLSLYNSMSHLTHHFTIKRIFEGLPLDIKWLQASCFKGNSNTPATTQREPHHTRPAAPTVPSSNSSNLQVLQH